MKKLRSPRKPPGPVLSFFRDHLWQPLKALICAVQFYVLDILALTAVRVLWHNMTAAQAETVILSLGALAIQLCLFVLLWWYYDHIDDLAFLELVGKTDPPPLWRRRSWQIAALLSTLAVLPRTAAYICWILSFTPLPLPIRIPIAVPCAAVLIFGIRALQVYLLNRKWMIQREMYDPAIPFPRLVSRILYAITFFLAMIAFIQWVVKTGVLVTVITTPITFVYLMVKEFPWLLSIPLLIFLPLTVIRRIRLLCKRKKFLRRLEALQDAGYISYHAVGHPYLAAITPRIQYSLYVTDKKGRNYRVSVHNCLKRRLTIIACDNHMLQYLLFSFGTRFMKASAFGIIVSSHTSIGTWYTNHAIHFPPEEPGVKAQNVVLLDPTPYVLSIRVGRHTAPLDNGSQAYDYTLYSKTAFLNWLERM